ncbi:small ubiquitin-like modifier (SUMO), partial [Thraustotheca clavata]
MMHWSRRHYHDTNKVLWAGWYRSSFKAIGHRFDRQSISAIPIVGYGLKQIFGKEKCDASQAIAIHHDVNSAAFIAIHLVGRINLFKVKPHTKMEKIFTAYAQRKGVPAAALRFLLDGTRIVGEQTPKMLELEDQDQIDSALEKLVAGY